MLRRVLKLSASPRTLLRSVLALDDSPHAIALGVAIGIFVGLTPTVGIQTAVVLLIVFLTRRFFYFNGSAAIAATYVSNPFTMLPLYYLWYRLGAWFVPGSMPFEQVRAALNFDGPAEWWSAMCALGIQVGGPMFIGALLTAVAGVIIAYPITLFLVKWARRPSEPGASESSDSTDGRVDDAHPKSKKPEGSASIRPPIVAQRVQNL